MAQRYTQKVTSAETRFTKAPMGVLEFSKMQSRPTHLTDFSAGELVPIYCAEVLPHDTFDIDMDFVIRQATALVPSMGQMVVDFYAFFVQNRVVNQSWKQLQGENLSGAWTQPEISLAPLVGQESVASIQVPVNSVADYYGFPTQAPLPVSVLRQCHDLKFRGYLEVYNNYFRDQNYQPPIPYSKLNVYNGFMLPAETAVGVDGKSGTAANVAYLARSGQTSDSDGDYYRGAVNQALFGGEVTVTRDSLIGPRLTSWSALDRPLKVNKMHDYFTSVLPSPQKGLSVVISSLTPMPVVTGEKHSVTLGAPMTVTYADGSSPSPTGSGDFKLLGYNDLDSPDEVFQFTKGTSSIGLQSAQPVIDNLYADPANSSITLNDLRMSAAIQQVYEILGRGGSRYREFINSFFGLDVQNPFDDIPELLGHFRRDLDLYQTAQTSASADGSAQGNLAAFGYTNKGGSLFHKTFLEHGYVHIFACVRHRNVYSSLMSRDNFRRTMLDFYSYPLANISEQPVYTREINPFSSTANDGVFGYQEAWAEYRMEPDRVSGHMRPGSTDTLAYWNYADEFDSGLQIADGDWLKSNSAEVLNRSIAIADTLQPQFKGQFVFKITKERPMPTYSVAGLDIL